MSVPVAEYAPAIAKGTARAATYVCVARPTGESDAVGRALTEGREFARSHGLAVVAEITDPYGEADPAKRDGWRQVRAMAANDEIDVVVTRWPACIAPESLHERRYEEIAALAADTVVVRFSWAPLAMQPEEIRL
ncbi:hypothetical protein [Streptomyces sp. TRM64462]|uniref:hypothetical protein n=1 Tax=Streptomyces sp. TRM64462 TaxID=2741726 RepID=UPI00158695D7|nr:hypothetical protein [Streptomyces sp. TRM64462]